MALLVDILSWAFLLVGSAFMLISGIGVLRLPDFYTRGHAAGIADTLGAGAILAGLMLQSGFTLVTVKLIIILALLLYTSPTSSHAVANAAIRSGFKPILADPPMSEPPMSEKEPEP